MLLALTLPLLAGCRGLFLHLGKLCLLLAEGHVLTTGLGADLCGQRDVAGVVVELGHLPQRLDRRQLGIRFYALAELLVIFHASLDARLCELLSSEVALLFRRKLGLLELIDEERPEEGACLL